jgi:hypothetical protein
MMALEKWETKRILILGMTYPNYSSKYSENVCTGGLEEGSCRMVRLHPIPHRYMEPEHRFKSYQWISASVTKHQNDPRPESLRVKPDSIEPGELVTQPGLKRELLEKSPHFTRSVEELKEREKRDHTSLGIVVPKRITGFWIEKKKPGAREEWAQKEREALAQADLFEYGLKPLDFPEVEFRIAWECDDTRCLKPHEMSLLQWGLHELYRKLKDDPDVEAKVLLSMKKQLDQTDRDVFLFLGSFRGLMYNFGLMDSHSIPRNSQIQLL